MAMLRRIMSAWCVVLAAAGCGDGGGDLDEEDCRAADYPCPSPFACIQCMDSADCLDTQLGEYSCVSPREGRPTCTEQPNGQVVPFATLDNGRTVHWAIRPGCIATSYDSSLSPRADVIRTSLNVWDNVGCSEICFDDPFETSMAPELLERRIHFTIDEILEPELVRVNAVTIARFEVLPDTGRITNVLVRIRSTDDPFGSHWHDSHNETKERQPEDLPRGPPTVVWTTCGIRCVSRQSSWNWSCATAPLESVDPVV